MGLFTRAIQKPSPLSSITASASKITGKTISRQLINSEEWQKEAWALLEVVGEQRFLANTISVRMGQAKIYVGKLSDDSLDDPEPVEDGLPAQALRAFGNGPISQNQMITRLGMNLYVTGDAYVVGIPRKFMPEAYVSTVDDDGSELISDGVDLNDVVWRVCSTDEITLDYDDNVTIQLDDKNSATGSADDFMIIRTWRPNPRQAWKADSPVRSSIPILRILSGLSMHMSSQIESRLAGAGILWIPQEIASAIKIAQGLPEDSEEDPFLDALMDAMTTPIEDRESVSSIVPLTVTAPGEQIAQVTHTSFTSELDSATEDMTNNALRRLALSQDAPPELLLGQGEANHWGSWLIKEDTVTTHIEPPLALICDALTTQYLWPLLEDQGYSRDDARQYVIWYDVTGLIQRPNKTQDALTLNERGVISDEALRDAADFDEEDVPTVHERVLSMIAERPELVSSPGIPKLFEQVKALMDQDEIPSPEDLPNGGEDPNYRPYRRGNTPDPDDDEDVDDGTGPPPKGVPTEPENGFSSIVKNLQARN